ncbi:MAG TPA: hypothetical protein VF832_16930, partial [Longimicrobiales bacterium]
MGLPPFRPSRHGFPFANEYDYSGHQLGRGAPVAATFGLGAGLCWAALDRYLGGRRIPRPLAAPQPGGPLYLELVQRQANAIMRMGWEKALRWQRLPDEGSGSTAGLSEMTRVEWRWVRRSLDAGTPVLLFLIRATGAFESPFENLFVLAYRYELDRRAGRLAIWVYDPNRPDNDEVRLTLAVGARRAPLQAHLALKDEVRGFFAVAYDREVPPSLGVEEARLTNGAPVLAGVPSLRLGSGRGLEVVARGPENELVVLTRDGKGSWRAGEVDRRGGIAPELRPLGSPVLAPRGPLRAFARSQSGELVEYSPRAFSGWRARSITAESGGSHGYGVDSDPALLATGTSLSLFARHGGDAVHFQLRRGRWQAENLSVRAKLQDAHNLVGELVATRGPDGTRHVFGRTHEGHLVHFRWRQDHGWAAQCVTSNLERFGIVDDPVALELPDERAVHVLARSAAGLPLDFRWSADSGWRVRAVHDELVAASPLSASVGPDGTMHAVARSAGGQLLHFWSRGELEWRAVDVTSGNGVLGEAYRIEGEPRLAIGPDEWLHVLARSGEDLLVYRWSPDADWTAESLSRDRGHRAALAADPVVLCAADGTVHALGIDARGTPVYLQAGVEDAPSRRALASTWVAFGYAVVDMLALPGIVAGRMLGERRRRKNRGKPVRAASAPSAGERHGPAAPRPHRTTVYEPPARTPSAPDPFAADPLPRGWGTVPAPNAAPVPDPYATNSLPEGWGIATPPPSGEVPPEPALPGLAATPPAVEAPDPYATAILPSEWGTAPAPVSESAAATPLPAGAAELEEALRLAASLAEAVPSEEVAPADPALELPPLVLPELNSAAPGEAAPAGALADDPPAQAPAADAEGALDRWERAGEIPPIIPEIPLPEPVEHPLAEERGFFEDTTQSIAPDSQEEELPPATVAQVAEPAPATEYAGPWAPVQENAEPLVDAAAEVDVQAVSPPIEREVEPEEKPVELFEARAPERETESLPEEEPVELVHGQAPEPEPELEPAEELELIAVETPDAVVTFDAAEELELIAVETPDPVVTLDAAEELELIAVQAPEPVVTLDAPEEELEPTEAEASAPEVEPEPELIEAEAAPPELVLEPEPEPAPEPELVEAEAALPELVLEPEPEPAPEPELIAAEAALPDVAELT